jgi:hypothetical protein
LEFFDVTHRIRGKSDKECREILKALAPYEAAHPGAGIEVHRQNDVSIRVRIIDPDFAALDLVERDNAIWKFLDGLPEGTLSNLTLLLLLTPDEVHDSIANFEFEHTVRSRL